jgi:hypothetical protein
MEGDLQAGEVVAVCGSELEFDIWGLCSVCVLMFHSCSSSFMRRHTVYCLALRQISVVLAREKLVSVSSNNAYPTNTTVSVHARSRSQTLSQGL